MPVSLTAWLSVKMYTTVEHDFGTTCYEGAPVLRDRFCWAEGVVAQDRFYCNSIFSDRAVFTFPAVANMPATLIWPRQSIGRSCQSSEMATLLNSFVFKIFVCLSIVSYIMIVL